jgi:ribosomal protein L18E
MMLALQVSQLGASPKWFASTKQAQPDFLDKISAHPKRGDTFSVIVPNKLLSSDKEGSRVTVLTVNGKENLSRWLSKASVHSFSVVNLSQAVRELDQNLAKTV